MSNAASKTIRVEPRQAIQGLLSSFPKVAGDECVALPVEAIHSGIMSGNAIFQFLKVATFFGCRAVFGPFEFFLRKRIGERYFSFPVYIALGAIATVVLIFGLVPPAVVYTHVAAFSIAAGLVSWRCFFRDRVGQYWHSYSEGEPRLKLTAIDRFLDEYYFTWSFSLLVVEPLALIAGWFVLRYGWFTQFLLFVDKYSQELPWFHEQQAFNAYYHFIIGLSWVFLAAGAATFLYQLHCYKYRRSFVLDEKDAEAELEAQQIAHEYEDTSGIHFHKGVAYRSEYRTLMWKE